MRLGRPREHEHEGAERADDDEGGERCVPTRRLHQPPQAPTARENGARIAEEAGEPRGGGCSALGRQIRPQ